MNNSENDMLLADKTKVDDEISLSDLVEFIRRHGAALLGGAIIGSVLGLIIAFALPAQWEANVVIKIGATGKTGALIETPSEVANRVKYTSFVDDVLKRLEISPNESADSKARLSHINLNIKEITSSLILISVQGVSRQEAEKIASTAIEELKDIHTKIAKQVTDLLHKELDEINLKLKTIDDESKLLRPFLNRRLNSFNKRDQYSATLANDILANHRAESHILQERKYILQNQLSPAITYPTSSWGPIVAPEQPVSPKKSNFAAGGLVIGLLIGLLLSLLKSSTSIDKRR